MRVLDRSSDTLVLYSHWQRTVACTSIPHLALEHFGSSLIFETIWRGRRYQWRLILPSEAKLSPFYEALEAEIDETVGVDVVHIRGTNTESLAMANDETGRALSPEQDSALQAAVERGYYETPRAIETYELAEKIGVPGSTLSYRLHRSEAQLAAAYVGQTLITPLPESNR